MDIKEIIDFKKAISEIPILSDPSFLEGNVEHIDDRSAVHFLIYPFLNILGYNIFKPDELRMNYVCDNENADIAIFHEGKPLAVFKLVALNKFNDLATEKHNFYTKELNKYKKFNSPLVIFTNGCDYFFYTFNNDKAEELVNFSLKILEGKSTDFLYKVFHKNNLVKALSNDKFFVEKIIENKFGKLRTSDYLVNLVAKELYNPSETLVKLFAKLIHQEYCNELSIDLISRKLKEELENHPGDLLEAIVSNVTGETKLEENSVKQTKEVNSFDNKKSNYDDWTKPDNDSDLSDLGKSDDDTAEGEELNNLLFNDDSAKDLGDLLK